MFRFFAQFFVFISVSGLGFIIDFGIYTILTSVCHFPVNTSNVLSAIPAITLVFFLSTKVVFSEKTDGLSLSLKYVLYFSYQILLITSVSYLGQYIFNILESIAVISYPYLLPLLPTITKVLITPITMTVNFFMLRYMTEKL